MATLYDRIIDEAENLVLARSLSATASREEIAEAVSVAVMEPFAPNSTFGKLAEAAFNRYMQMQMVG